MYLLSISPSIHLPTHRYIHLSVVLLCLYVCPVRGARSLCRRSALLICSLHSVPLSFIIVFTKALNSVSPSVSSNPQTLFLLVGFNNYCLHLRLGLANSLFSWDFKTENLNEFLISLVCATCSDTSVRYLNNATLSSSLCEHIGCIWNLRSCFAAYN